MDSVANINGTLNFSPTMNTIEMHRVVAVLEKGIERLQLLTILNYETPTEGAAGLGATAGGKSGSLNQSQTGGTQQQQPQTDSTTVRGVGSILEEQKRLEARYEELLQATKRFHRNPNDPALDQMCFAHIDNPAERAQLEELRVISQKLKEQSKLLCRQLKDNPNDADNWKKVVNERGELITILSSCVRELASSATTMDGMGAASEGAAAAAAVNMQSSYEVFAKKILDEQSASQWADDLVKKEKETNQNVKQLQNQVKHEKAEKERELAERHQQIVKLKAQLRELKQADKEARDKMRAETEARSEALQRKALDDQRLVRNVISSLRDKTENESQVTADFREHVDSKLRLLEQRTEEWSRIQRERTREMEQKKADVERTRATAAETKSEKEAAMQLAEINKQTRDEELRVAAEAKRKREEDANRRYLAATKLQASIKAMFTRQVLAVLKKKAGKKKK